MPAAPFSFAPRRLGPAVAGGSCLRDDGADLASAIEEADRRLDVIGSRIETCRQAMILSRGALTCGLALLAAVTTVVPAFNTAPVVLPALTAAIGGLVWLGANQSSRTELETLRAAAECERAALFDQVVLRNGWSAPPQDVPP